MGLFVIILLIAPVLSDLFNITINPLYSGKYDIIKIVVPINRVNFNHEYEIGKKLTYFFVEADISKGKDYKGLYVSKNGKVTKLLDDGTDISTANDTSFNVFFATKRGIYSYNHKTNKADKYGNFSEEIIGIANKNGEDLILVVTKDKKVFKIVDHGYKKIETKYTGVDQIVFDYANNLYFLIKKNPCLVTEIGVTKIKGLHANPNYILLGKDGKNEGIAALSDKWFYRIDKNEVIENELNFTLTAFSLEAVAYRYSAYNKKIYGLDILKEFISIITTVEDAMKDFPFMSN